MYPNYTRAEKIADGIIHAIGITASVSGVVVLLAIAIPTLDASSSSALAIYGLTVVTLFTVSAAYHMIGSEGWKPWLRRCDQAAIFFKIAGTYTPLVLLLGNMFAYSVLAFVWVAALVGAIAKLSFWSQFEKFSTILFLALGWASVTLAWPIFDTLPLAVSVLILSGGVLYSVGVIFHQWDSLKFQNAIWHGFVLAASTCHFGAVVYGTFALAV
ncbi:PAQR family membrane homeostasis protein TrhA [Oricola cellulosilytica]|uniref:Hemolysin III n=1 Tax=Oricola cellulosilytica TaxID=1429082 RepID=A0A4R0PD24_9HYPH|nr:hemolysin III family protein [Oricola cellulosilytica]TCD14318.1 hemolysin III [Oricola cellulosilytica]